MGAADWEILSQFQYTFKQLVAWYISYTWILSMCCCLWSVEHTGPSVAEGIAYYPEVYTRIRRGM